MYRTGPCTSNMNFIIYHNTEEKIYFRLITNLTKNIYKNIIFLANIHCYNKILSLFFVGRASKLLTLASIKKILIVEPWPVKTVWKMCVFSQDIKALKVGCEEKCVQGWYRPLLSPVFFLLHSVAYSPIAHWSPSGPPRPQAQSLHFQDASVSLCQGAPPWWHLRQRTLGVTLQGQ